MQRLLVWLQHYVRLGMGLLVLLPWQSFADCSCTVGANGIYALGLELVATTCPADPPSDNRVFTYQVNPLKCEGNTIRNYSTYGDITASPAQLIAYYISQGYRVLRNPSGTHLIAVQKGSYPFTGFVSGVNMSTAAAGVYYSTPASSMDQYCTARPVADQDGDGIPDCLEQLELLLPYNFGSPCPAQ